MPRTPARSRLSQAAAMREPACSATASSPAAGLGSGQGLQGGSAAAASASSLSGQLPGRQREDGECRGGRHHGDPYDRLRAQQAPVPALQSLRRVRVGGKQARPGSDRV